MRKLIVAACVVLIFGGCAGDQEDNQTVATPTSESGNLPYFPPGGGEAVECIDLTEESQPIIQMHDFRFEPPCVVLTTDQGFGTQNKGENRHNLSIEDVAAVDVDTEPGAENNYDPPGLEQNTYTFFCKYHRDRGMEGQLRVESG